MGTTKYFGRRVTTTDTDFAEQSADAQRFYVPDALDTTMIAYRMEMLGGKLIGQTTPKVRLAIAASSGSTPGSLLAYTDEFSVTNNASYGGDGQVVGADLTGPILMTPTYYGLGAASDIGPLGVVMRQAANLSSGENRNFYTKYNALNGSIPSNPVGGAQEYNGHLDIWVVGVTNTAPLTPDYREPSGFLTNTDLTPDLSANFRDSEKTLPNGDAWDYVQQVNIQVYRVSDNVKMWDTTYTTTTTERNAHRSTKTYAGTALSAGIDYKWRIRHADRAGAWGPWSDYLTFQVNPGGNVGTPTGPSGKQTDDTPNTFTAPWTHAGGLSTNAVEIRLLSSGTVIKTSPTITKTVANNATISITHAESTFGTLSHGAAYTFQVRGRDTGNVWSPWSATQAFSINADPTTPTNRTPGGGQAVSSYPLLVAQTSDPDDATSTLSMSFELVRTGGTVTRTGTYNATTGKHQYQTTSTDLTAYQTFTWRARATDAAGYVSAWSPYETVIYGAGPAVTVDAPTDSQILTTSTPLISWTATGQVSRRVRVYRQDDGTLVHDSGTTTTATQTYTVPSGILRNDTGYYVIVDVTNSAPLTGTSAARNFSIDFVDPPAITSFQTNVVSIGNDEYATAIRLDWDMTSYIAGNFVGYDLYRTPMSGPDAGVATLLRRITSPLQTTFTDYHPQSGMSYTYSIRQTIQQDLDVLVSPATEAIGSLTLDGIVLASALEPTTYRASLRYLASGNPSHSLRRDDRHRVPLGARLGRTIRSGYLAWEPEGSFMILSDANATADQRMDELRSLVENAKTLSYRDHRGRKRWVTITDYEETDIPSGYVVELGFREEYFIEGEIL